MDLELRDHRTAEESDDWPLRAVSRPQPGARSSVLYDAMLEAAAGRLDSVAVHGADARALDYRDLIALTDRITAGLLACGVGEGDAVAVQLAGLGPGDGPGYVALLLAVSRLGASYLTLPRDIEVEDTARALLSTRPALVVSEGVLDALCAHPQLAEAPALGSRPHAGPYRILLDQQDTDAARGRSSWSQSVWHQDALLAERRRWLAEVRLTSADVVFVDDRFGAAHNEDLLFAALLSGARIVLADCTAPTAGVLRRIEASQATVMSALPRHYAQLIGTAERAGGVRLSRLRLALCDAYLTPDIVVDAARVLGVRIMPIYRTAQAGTVLGNAADVPLPVSTPHNRRFARLGMFPLPGVRARIAPQAPGRADVGELVLRADHVAEQRRNAATADGAPVAASGMLRGGELWTGDLARRDADGSVRLLGPLRAAQPYMGPDEPAEPYRPALRHRRHSDFGPALVFIPGAGTTARFFDQAVAALSRDHTVVTVDLPGHGLSARVPVGEQPAADLPGVTRAVHRVLCELDLEEVTLAGWAFGASVAFDYVERYGTDRIRSLICIEHNPRLLAGGGWPHPALGGIDVQGAHELLEGLKRAGDETAENLVRGSFAPGSAPDPLLLCDLVAEAQGCNPAAVRALLADAFEQDWRERAARIKVPTLLVHGAHSAICPPDAGRWLAGIMPDARLSVFEDCGHLPFVERPQRFAAEARAFVARAGAQR